MRQVLRLMQVHVGLVLRTRVDGQGNEAGASVRAGLHSVPMWTIG